MKITKHFGKDGSVDIKVDGFTLVHINYDYRYTNNAHRSWLASTIVSMLETTLYKNGTDKKD